jgi:hypothetical protein
MKTSRTLCAALASICFLAPAWANAACTQADLAGTWIAYSLSGDQWASCRLVIASNGRIANTSCARSTGDRVSFTNGSARVAAPACIFTAQYTVGGQIVERVIHGTIARDKTTAQGVGLSLGDGFLFSLTKL